jgi:acyl carrier protein
LDKEKFLEMIEGILEVKRHSLEGRECLADVEQWDSIAILDYIAAVDQQCELALKVDEIAACQTFDDLYRNLAESLRRVGTARSGSGAFD